MEIAETILNRVEKANSNADYIDVRIEETESTAVSVKGREIENVSQPVSYGGIARVFKSGVWSYFSFSGEGNNTNGTNWVEEAVYDAAATEESFHRHPDSPDRHPDSPDRHPDESQDLDSDISSLIPGHRSTTWGARREARNDKEGVAAAPCAAGRTHRSAPTRVGNALRLQEVPAVEDKIYAGFIKDPREVTLGEKIQLLKKYNKILLKLPNIQSTRLSYLDTVKKKWFASSQGSAIYQEQPRILLGVSAIARSGDNVQPAGCNFSSLENYADVEDLDREIEQIGKQAGRLLDAPPVKSGTYTVVLGPAMSGLFAHEAFGHLSEADFIYENKALRKVMQLGRKFGPDILNIVDDPALREFGHYVYDDEGVRGRKKYLIKEGVLNARLHNRETGCSFHCHTGSPHCHSDSPDRHPDSPHCHSDSPDCHPDESQDPRPGDSVCLPDSGSPQHHVGCTARGPGMTKKEGGMTERDAEIYSGNGRAVSYNNPPLVRMSNTYIEPGESTLSELIRDIDEGILTHRWLGGMTDREMFTFTAGWGQVIKNGKLGQIVRDVKLTGNVFNTLKNIDGISKDLQWEAGQCGKGGQGGLPTATGGPYLRVRGVKVGGR